MPDEITPGGTATPAAPAANQQPPAPAAPQAAPATPPAAVAAPAAPKPADPNAPWLNQRLADKEKAVLRELGVTDIAQAKQILADAAAKAEATKTADQRLVEATARATAEAERATRATALLSEQNSAMLETLPEKFQEKVRAVGDDPIAQAAKLRELAEMADLLGVDLFPETAAAGAQPPAGATPPAPAKTVPANTAPPPTAPPAAGTQVTDHKARYEELRRENPVRAANYLNTHLRQIYPAQ